MSLPLLDQVTASVSRFSELLQPVAVEKKSIAEIVGRILAQPLLADRDSPPIDVSAMDGFAIRMADLQGEPLKIVGTAAAGSPPVELHPRTAVRIFTGGPVPSDAEAVVRREDADIAVDQVSIRTPPHELRYGQNIRRCGENIRTGQELLPPGTLLTTAAMSAIATFGASELSVYARVRVSILNTGDELIPPGEPAQPWQIRDSNGPVLETMLRLHRWIHVVHRQAVTDKLAILVEALNQQLASSDAILLTGGVSMGDYDFVPEAILQCGGKIIFHRLPIRPGKPILGAMGPGGQLIVGLPGNPVSVAVTAKRFAFPLLRKLGGLANVPQLLNWIPIVNPDSKVLDLIWYRLVKLVDNGKGELLDSHGSGDLVSLALSDGFVEVPAGQSGPGPWKYFSW
ncbi:MAG: molybdopterin molybdotransferase MoeA [Pirellulaceae bacterium]|nr:molybdopterin molybdotransferase MoeA [Pirellulaceae bacterium]